MYGLGGLFAGGFAGGVVGSMIGIGEVMGGIMAGLGGLGFQWWSAFQCWKDFGEAKAD